MRVHCMCAGSSERGLHYVSVVAVVSVLRWLQRWHANARAHGAEDPMTKREIARPRAKAASLSHEARMRSRAARAAGSAITPSDSSRSAKRSGARSIEIVGMAPLGCELTSGAS